MSPHDILPEPQRWVCAACGKTSRTQYGTDERGSFADLDGLRYADRMWDESCILHAVRCVPAEPGSGYTWRAAV